MKKAFDYAETLAQEYHHLPNRKALQKVFKEHQKESYSSAYAGGVVKLQATGSSASVYALRELIIGEASGRAGEVYGQCEPRFGLRPLWPECDSEVKIGEASIYLPHYLLSDPGNISTFCTRLLELGYNAVLLNRRRKSSLGQGDVSFILNTLREYGIKIILSIDGQVPDNLPFDFLFREAKGQDSKSKKTELEKLVAEVRELEKLKLKLIYYLPAKDEAEAEKQSGWMSQLMDECGPSTMLAFPCVAGPATENYLPLHPFWKKLGESPDVSATPLLPIVNIGGVGSGEGLWPALNVRVMDCVFARMDRHVFAGIIGLVGQLPKRDGLLDCSLWAASQFLWSGRRLERSIETWFAAHHPQMTYDRLFEMLDGVAVDLQALRGVTGELSQEESRSIAESILARLKEVQVKLEMTEKKALKRGDELTLYDYFVPFERDARRLVLQFLQRYHVAMASLVNTEDVQEAFWTQFQGTRSGKVTVLDVPHSGAGKMKKIFADNRLF